MKRPTIVGCMIFLLFPDRRAGETSAIDNRRGMVTRSGLIITGASRGIGAATARLAGQNGYKVVVNYVRDEAAANSVVSDIRDSGGTAIAVRADIARKDDILNLFETADAEVGPIVGLVNNAGITGPIGLRLCNRVSAYDSAS